MNKASEQVNISYLKLRYLTINVITSYIKNEPG